MYGLNPFQDCQTGEGASETIKNAQFEIRVTKMDCKCQYLSGFCRETKSLYQGLS